MITLALIGHAAWVFIGWPQMGPNCYVWPWLSLRWLYCCTPGSPRAQERICPTVTKFANIPLLKARWACSVSHSYDHLAAIFVPSISLEDGIEHIEALTKFT